MSSTRAFCRLLGPAMLCVSALYGPRPAAAATSSLEVARAMAASSSGAAIPPPTAASSSGAVNPSTATAPTVAPGPAAVPASTTGASAAGPDGVDVIEHLGSALPTGLRFRDSTGREVSLGDELGHGRPVVLALVYFDCPMLCSNVLAGIVRGFREAGIVPGKDADLLTVSFNPADTVRAAAVKRAHYTQSLGIDAKNGQWPFLTGDEANIRALADALGFHYACVADTAEFAHAAVVFVLTDRGIVSRYLYGIDLPVRDLRLSLVEASQGRFGTSFDRFLLHCYRYDPASRRYAPFISAYFRIGGLVVLLVVGAFLVRLWRREVARRGDRP